MWSLWKNRNSVGKTQPQERETEKNSVTSFKLLYPSLSCSLAGPNTTHSLFNSTWDRLSVTFRHRYSQCPRLPVRRCLPRLELGICRFVAAHTSKVHLNLLTYQWSRILALNPYQPWHCLQGITLEQEGENWYWLVAIPGVPGTVLTILFY